MVPGGDVAGLLRQVEQDRKNWTQVTLAMQGAIAEAEALAQKKELENVALAASLRKVESQVADLTKMLQTLEGEKNALGLAKENMRAALLTSHTLRAALWGYFQIKDAEAPLSLTWLLGTLEIIRKIKKSFGK